MRSDDLSFVTKHACSLANALLKNEVSFGIPLTLLIVLECYALFAGQQLLHQAAFLLFEGGALLAKKAKFGIGGVEDIGDFALQGRRREEDVEVEELVGGDIEKSVGTGAFFRDRAKARV